ncbi:MAG: ADP-ribosylglycohydrolase family protein, partial [Planctomycetes bacterium]|nr:ADP-ribosylglycohydrolase family protein [Planctomycetota bacterium]
SYEECVRAAISLGGDTDTQAAVTGAVAGAAWGLEGIPEHLRGVERAEEIIRLAERLAELSLSAGPA